jgi:hypothetical protein
MNTKNLMISTSVLVFSLAISLLFFAIFYERPRQVLLYYPNQLTGEIDGEIRTIIYSRDKLENISKVIQENLQAPVNQQHLRIVSRDTEIKAVYLQDNRVIVDLTGQILKDERDVSANPDRAFYVLEKTIRHSFRDIGDITFAIDGLEYQWATDRVYTQIPVPEPLELPVLKPGRVPAEPVDSPENLSDNT